MRVVGIWWLVANDLIFRHFVRRRPCAKDSAKCSGRWQWVVWSWVDLSGGMAFFVESKHVGTAPTGACQRSGMITEIHESKLWDVPGDSQFCPMFPSGAMTVMVRNPSNLVTSMFQAKSHRILVTCQQKPLPKPKH